MGVNVNNIYIRPSPGRVKKAQVGGRAKILHAETAQVDQHAGLQQLLRRHWQCTARRVAAAEERCDTVCQCPHMQRQHQRGRSGLERCCCDQRFSCRAQHGEGAVTGFAQLRICIERNTRLEHRRVVGRLASGESQIGAAQSLEGRERMRPTTVPSLGQRRFELAEPAQRHTGEQFIAVAKMPVGRGRTDAGGASRLRKGEATGPLLGDEVERGPHQGLLEVAVVIAARRCLPAHVNNLYMTPRESSTGAADQLAAAD